MGQDRRGESQNEEAQDHLDEPLKSSSLPPEWFYEPYRQQGHQEDVNRADDEAGLDVRRVALANNVGEARGGVVDDNVDVKNEVYLDVYLTVRVTAVMFVGRVPLPLRSPPSGT